MRVRAIMTPANELTILRPNATAEEAIKLIEDNGFLSLPVAEGDCFLGFLSKQYVYDRYFEEKPEDVSTFMQRPVSDFVHHRVTPIDQSLLIEEAADLFFKNKIRFLPVIDDRDKFLGIVTQNALFGILTKIYGMKHAKISILTDDFKGILSRIAETIAKNDGNIKNIALLDTEVMGIQEISIRLEGDDIDRIVEKLEEKGFKVREYIK